MMRNILLCGVSLACLSACQVPALLEDIPPGPHHVWTSDPHAGHVSLLLEAGEQVVLRMDSAADPRGGWRLERIEAAEVPAALAEAFAEAPLLCRSGHGWRRSGQIPFRRDHLIG